MKILIIHNIYSTVGGEESVVSFQKQLLESKGHNVKIYSREYKDMNYWLLGKAWGTFTSIYNPRSKRDLNKIIKDFSPQIAILHNLLPIISPSIIPFLKHKGIKIWQIVHNYRIYCPLGTFFANGDICQKCLGKYKELNCILNNCTGSIISSTSFSFRNFYIRKFNYYKYVDKFFPLSEFQRNLLIENGLDRNKVITLPNSFMYDEKHDNKYDTKKKKNIGFVGRLTKEKGILDFIEIAKLLPEYEFTVAGKTTKYLDNIQIPSNLKFLGYLNKNQLEDFYSSCKVLLVLSRWYEPFGLVIIESMYKQTPTIVYNIGAMPEIIDDNVDGYIVEIGDYKSIIIKIKEMFFDQNNYERIIKNCLIKVEKYSAEKYYNKLIEND